MDETQMQLDQVQHELNEEQARKMKEAVRSVAADKDRIKTEKDIEMEAAEIRKEEKAAHVQIAIAKETQASFEQDKVAAEKSKKKWEAARAVAQAYKQKELRSEEEAHTEITKAEDARKSLDNTVREISTTQRSAAAEQLLKDQAESRDASKNAQATMELALQVSAKANAEAKKVAAKMQKLTKLHDKALTQATAALTQMKAKLSHYEAEAAKQNQTAREEKMRAVQLEENVKEEGSKDQEASTNQTLNQAAKAREEEKKSVELAGEKLKAAEQEVRETQIQGDKEMNAALQQEALTKRTEEEAKTNLLKKEENLQAAKDNQVELKRMKQEAMQLKLDTAAGLAAKNAAQEALMMGLPASEVEAAAKEASAETEAQGIAQATITDPALLKKVLQKGNATKSVEIAMNAVSKAEGVTDKRDEQVDSSTYGKEDAGTDQIMAPMKASSVQPSGIPGKAGIPASTVSSEEATDSAQRQTRITKLKSKVEAGKAEETRRQAKHSEDNSEGNKQKAAVHAQKMSERENKKAAFAAAKNRTAASGSGTHMEVSRFPTAGGGSGSGSGVHIGSVPSFSTTTPASGSGVHVHNAPGFTANTGGSGSGVHKRNVQGFAAAKMAASGSGAQQPSSSERRSELELEALTFEEMYEYRKHE